MDICASRKLIVTSSGDEKIKIWTYRKVLVMQLNVDDTLHGAWFVNTDGDIIVAHDGNQ